MPVLSGDQGTLTVPRLQFPQEQGGRWAGVFVSMVGG